jgi:hypothetical protein
MTSTILRSSAARSAPTERGAAPDQMTGPTCASWRKPNRSQQMRWSRRGADLLLQVQWNTRLGIRPTVSATRQPKRRCGRRLSVSYIGNPQSRPVYRCDKPREGSKKVTPHNKVAHSRYGTAFSPSLHPSAPSRFVLLPQRQGCANSGRHSVVIGRPARIDAQPTLRMIIFAESA